MMIVHIVSGILLLLAHGVFLFRGLAMRRNGLGPKSLDRAARFLSHFGLPLAIATGFLAVSPEPGPEWLSALHIVLGLLPVVAILGLTPFLSLRRRIPWLLPGINLVLIASAAVAGTLLRVAVR